MSEPAAPLPDDRRRPRLTYLVKRLEMAERARLEEVLRPLGVTVHQYTALSILERRDGLSSAQLARRHFVTAQAMNQMVAAMERDGLIVRQPDPMNRKILRVSLTERGWDVLRACHEGAEDLERRMLAALTPAQIAAFRSALEVSLVAISDPTL